MQAEEFRLYSFKFPDYLYTERYGWQSPKLFLVQAEEFRLYSFKFLDHLYTDSTTVKIVLRMFLDFDLVSRFKIPYQVVL